MLRWAVQRVTGHSYEVALNQLVAVCLNLLSWLHGYSPVRLIPLPAPPTNFQRQAVVIAGPGGLDRLNATDLGERATVGYNMQHFCPPPFTPELPTSQSKRDAMLPPDCVLVRIGHFSVNYADVTIRWGLYESASRYVGFLETALISAASTSICQVQSLVRDLQLHVSDPLRADLRL